MVPLDLLLDVVAVVGVIVAVVAVVVAVAVANVDDISVIFFRTTTITIPYRTAIISSFPEHPLSRSLPLLRLPILLSPLLSSNGKLDLNVVVM